VGALIKDVGLKSALVPRYPGITSALGCIIADVRHDQVCTLNMVLGGMDTVALDQRMVETGQEAHAVVVRAGLAVEQIDVTYELDMHYQGQTHTVSVPLPVVLSGTSTGVSEAIIRRAFETSYAAVFSRLLPEIPVRIVNLRTAGIGRRPAFDMAMLAPEVSATREQAFNGQRPVWFDGRWHTAEIWDRLALPVGSIIHGPAILEQGDATTVIDPGLVARVDEFGNLIVERRP
jgi:N-methylhydantoinase A